MEFLMEFVEGFGLIEAVVSAFLAFLGYAGKKVFPFVRESLKSIQQETNSGIIAWLAEEAVAVIDERFKGENGDHKFNQAVNWLRVRANEYGIDISEEEIRGSIQQGYNLTIGQEKKAEKEQGEQSQ